MVVMAAGAPAPALPVATAVSPSPLIHALSVGWGNIVVPAATEALPVALIGAIPALTAFVEAGSLAFAISLSVANSLTAAGSLTAPSAPVSVVGPPAAAGRVARGVRRSLAHVEARCEAVPVALDGSVGNRDRVDIALYRLLNNALEVLVRVLVIGDCRGDENA